MEPNRMYLRLIFLALILVFANCRKSNENSSNSNFVSEHSNDVIYKWNELILQIDRDAMGYRPGPGPRALSYIGLAAYEICVPGMPSFASLIEATFLLHNFYKNTIFIGGAGHLTNAEVHLKIDELRSSFASKYEILINPEEIKNSLDWGKSVSKAIWEWSVTDKFGHEADLNPLNNDPSKINYYPVY